MAIYKTDVVEIKLETGNIHRSFFNHTIGKGDNSSDRFGVRLMRNEENVDLTGVACIGYFIRPDGITLVINGEKDNGVAYVELPEAAYAKEGQFVLTIKLTGTGFSGAMRIIDGTIVKTTTGNIADPASEIPSLESLEEIIGQAEEAAGVIDGINVAAEVITGTRYKITVTKE